ncbi:hypothetical protein HGRIS_012772 [Hohenbuehelia grisea]|uniref:AB hydrolase-1 domain-containing protein n=1 Tax=Hohenbuehelia grisea TaxID=104357 RepID=A0ABR3ITK0_9AGAR
MAPHSAFTLHDGAKLAYEVLGAQFLEQKEPIVLVNGMTTTRGDWERLANSLSEVRPVLLFDHRGMGDSTYSTPEMNDVITIESMARDLVMLLEFLGWKEVILCVVVQQLLFLPHHAQNPVSLPFKPTHVIFAATLASVLRDKRYGVHLKFPPPEKRASLTDEDKKDLSRDMLDRSFDPAWLAIPENKPRYEWWLNRMIRGRPARTILQQGRTLNRFNFAGLHDKLPRDMKILVLHGVEDLIVPFSSSEEICKLIPWAKRVEVGTQPGQTPSLSYGHNWFEYFDINAWRDVIEVFVENSKPERQAKL